MLLIKNKSLRVALGFLETFNFLSLRLLLKNRPRARSFAGKIFRTYMSLVQHDKWRSQSIDELFPQMSECRVVIEHMKGGGIITPVDELAYLAILTRNIRPKNVFEIGTFRGRTALNFALNSPPECIVHTLDLAPENRDAFKKTANADDAALIERSYTGVDYQGKDGAEKIRQWLGDSTTFDFAPYHGQMDIVFVDGAHHYAAVASDTKNALKMVRDGGWIVWHDFATYGDYNDVTRAVLDTLPASDVIQIDSTLLAVYRKQASPARS